MSYLIFVPFLVQALVIGIDEWAFHLKRGLPKWERIGHPIDTLTLLLCLGFVILVPYSKPMLWIFIGLSLFSCLMVTKDEFVHKEHCPAKEQWLHALLFLNHPVVLTCMGLMWPDLGVREDMRFFLYVQGVLISLFCLYQIIYWNIIWKEQKK